MKSNKPVRLLCVIGKMVSGGAETMLMKLYRQVDKNKIQFDFLVFTEEEAFYDREIYNMGGKIYRMNPISYKKNFIYVLYKIYKFLKINHYKYVLQSTDQAHTSLIVLMAKIARVDNIAIRSINSSARRGKQFDELEKKISFLPRLATNIRFAPSHLAADFLFGKDSVKKHNVHILHNGLDLNLFTFYESIRNEKRIELNLDNKFIVGHVGRLSEQKNHSFLLKVFKEITDKRDDAILLLIGTGDLKQDIRNQAQDLGVANKVIFAGVRSDVNECLMAMDVMVFSSFYEGMPNVVIEAQTTGLPCIVSDTITEECQVTDRVKFMSLDNSPELWADAAIESANCSVNRVEYVGKMQQAGYDIKDVANEFVKYMFNSGQ